MPSMFDAEELDHDFSDEFVAALGGAGEAILNAHDREAAERAARFGEDEGEDETGQSLLDAVLNESEVEGRETQAQAPAEREVKAPAKAYNEDDARALESLFKPKGEESAEARQLRELRERTETLERELAAARGQQAAPARQPANSGKVKPTGNAEIDAVLEEAGILDRTPELPPETETRLQRLERQNQELHEARLHEQRVSQLMAHAKQRAAAVAKVFKDVDEMSIAQVILAQGDGLEFARAVYRKAGALGPDGMPARHLSDSARKPMPHAVGVQNSRLGRTSRSDSALGWTPTDDPAERSKRLASYRR